MSVKITVPAAGESVSSGTLAAWLKEDGASVSEGDELFELETDKATLAVPAPAGGRLHHTVAEGTEVEVGSVVGEILADEGAANPAAERPTVAAARPSAPPPAAAIPDLPPSVQPTPTPSSAADALSPAVRRIVEEGKLNPRSIAGTGKDGRITKEDALRAAEGSGAAPRQSAGSVQAGTGSPAARQEAPADGQERRTERVPMTTIRRRIAEHLIHAKQEAAHLTTFNEIDMSNVMAIRSRYRDAFEAQYKIKLGFMSFFVKACCQALREFPDINAFLDGTDIVYNHFYDIGVAVSSDRGLVVPVIRDADRHSFAAIELQIADIAYRVRERRITVDELTGGTFTVTNGGVFGSLLSTPIPNFPQSAILGMHTIQKRPIAVDDQVVIRPMMYVALTYDHRIVDGSGAVKFLVRIKQFVENPERLLLEV